MTTIGYESMEYTYVDKSVLKLPWAFLVKIGGHTVGYSIEGREGIWLPASGLNPPEDLVHVYAVDYRKAPLMRRVSEDLVLRRIDVALTNAILDDEYAKIPF